MVGSKYLYQEDSERALNYFNKSLITIELVNKDEPEQNLLKCILYDQMAQCYTELGQIENVVEIYEKALKTAEIHMHTSTDEFSEKAAYYCDFLAFICQEQGKFIQADVYYSQGYGYFKPLYEKFPPQFGFQFACLSYEYGVMLREHLDNYPKAERMFLESYIIYKKLYEDNPAMFSDRLLPSYLMATSTLASFYHSTTKEYQKSLPYFELMFALDPDENSFHYKVAYSLSVVDYVQDLISFGKKNDAMKTIEKALQFFPDSELLNETYQKWK